MPPEAEFDEDAFSPAAKRGDNHFGSGKMAEKLEEKPATGTDVRRILGAIEDDLVMSILATGATVEEVTEAYEWFGGSDRMGTDLDHTRRGRVGAVYEILARDYEEAEER